MQSSPVLAPICVFELNHACRFHPEVVETAVACPKKLFDIDRGKTFAFFRNFVDIPHRTNAMCLLSHPSSIIPV